MTRGRKKSTFITQDSVPDDHFIDTFGNGVNRKIPKPNFFKQIRDEVNTFIYENTADLQAANLEADPDDPVYVRVAETGFWLYRITSLAATDLDIELNNGTTATRVYEETAVIPLDNITSLSSLNTSALVDGQQFSVGSYLPNTSTGSALLRWRPDLPKSRHDGVLFFSLTVPMFTGTDTTDYRNGVGETDPGGNGVMELVRGEIIYDAMVPCGQSAGDIYESWNSAIHDLHGRIQCAAGVTIECRLSSGSEVVEGVECFNGEYGQYIISAEDEIVDVSDQFSTDRVFHFNNARAPVVSARVDGRSIANRGAWYTNACNGVINGGVDNVRERGLYINNSRVHGDSAIFKGAGQDGTGFGRALWITRSGALTCENLDISGHAGPEYAIYLSRASSTHAAYFVCESSAAAELVRVHRGCTFNGQELDNVHGGSAVMFSLTRGSNLVVNGSTFTDVQGKVVDIQDANSSANLDDCTIVAASGNTQPAFEGRTGRISSQRSEIQGFGRAYFGNRGGYWNASSSEISGQSIHLCEGQRGTEIHLTNSTLLTGTGVDAVRIGRGSQAWVFDTTVNGSPISTGDTNISSFNAINGSNGIIWS